MTKTEYKQLITKWTISTNIDILNLVALGLTHKVKKSKCNKKNPVISKFWDFLININVVVEIEIHLPT